MNGNKVFLFVFFGLFVFKSMNVKVEGKKGNLMNSQHFLSIYCGLDTVISALHA